eukprot:symbB.v1.2.008356.t1/scaffold524.1/size192337/5
MFEAPDPTIEEIWVFRQSVQERVALLGNEKDDPELNQALLLEVTNKPPRSPSGDAMDPSPIEDPTPAKTLEPAGGSGDVAAGPEATGTVDVKEVTPQEGTTPEPQCEAQEAPQSDPQAPPAADAAATYLGFPQAYGCFSETWCNDSLSTSGTHFTSSSAVVFAAEFFGKSKVQHPLGAEQLGQLTWTLLSRVSDDVSMVALLA